jgi:hypothetical protein
MQYLLSSGITIILIERMYEWMSEQEYTFETDDLEEALLLVNFKITEGLYLYSQKIISDGKPKSLRGSAVTMDEAFIDAEKQIPSEAAIISKKEITNPGTLTLTVDAFDEQSARKQFGYKINSTSEIKSIQVSVPKKNGFFGIGKKPGQFKAEIFQKAVAEVTYKMKAKVTATIGESKRYESDLKKLENAESHGQPVDVICEHCGAKCRALAHPVSENTVMVMTPQQAIMAARYCEPCHIVVCGACVGVSLYSTGMSMGGRKCPNWNCRQETTYAAISHLKLTNTKLCI